MVQTSNDLRYLLKGIDYDNLPEIDQNEFVDAWEKIREQWSETIGSNQADLGLLRKKLLAQLKHAYNYQMSMYRSLLVLPVPELIEVFNSCGFSVDIDNYETTMQRAYGKLMKKKAQFELEEGNEDKNKEPLDFDELIVLMESLHHFTESEHTMSVRKFGKIYKKVTQDGRRKNKKE